MVDAAQQATKPKEPEHDKATQGIDGNQARGWSSVLCGLCDGLTRAGVEKTKIK